MKKLKNIKGITLIALVITIVVLLILAGVTIAMLTGDNGILTKAQNAKIQNNKASVKEQIELAVQASRINTDVSIDRSVLETELLNYKMEITKGENDEFPWTVKKDGYVFTISGTGEVKEKVGIAITTGNIEILSGSTEGKILTAQLLNGETGTIKWSCEGNNIAISETTGETTTLTLGNDASAGDTAIITAEIDGKNQKDSINVKVVAQATGLTVEPITLAVGKEMSIKKVTVNPDNSEEVQIKSYTVSENTNVATVNEEDGMVSALEEGTAKITVLARGKLSGIEVAGICTVTVEKKLISVTAEQIAAKPKAYYGKKVENYKASADDNNTYRIFYVSTKDDEFGDPQYTVYLKADYSGSYDLNSYESYDETNTKVKEMNPKWANERGESKDSWNINEQAAAYLCSPVNKTTYATTSFPWKDYFNSEKANYVIGGPSVEMYVKSYNQVEAYNNATADAAKYELESDYRETSYPGYIYTIKGARSTISKNDYYTGTNSLDYSKTYDNMYCGSNGSKTGGWWLASPSAWRSGTLCFILGVSASLNGRYDYPGNYYTAKKGISPLVSLQSGFQPQIEQ